MSALDQPVFHTPLSKILVWTEVFKDGQRYAVQVQLIHSNVEDAINRIIENDKETHTKEVVDGNLKMTIVRMS